MKTKTFQKTPSMHIYYKYQMKNTLQNIKKIKNKTTDTRKIK